MATELGLLTWFQQLVQSQQTHRHHQQSPSSGGWMFLYPTKQDQFQDESWEVKAFEEDKNSIMGSTWPPRSYTCTFCQREFRSAQALGGHMNVHRRDRAKLHESQRLPSLHNTYQTHAPTISNTIGSSGTINFSLMDSYSTRDSSKIESSSMFTENRISRRDLANDDDDDEIDLELRLGHK